MNWVTVSYLCELRVFVSDGNYVIVTATTVDILFGVLEVLNVKGGRGVTLFETKMRAPTKGLGISVIEGSKKTGQIFFSGRGDGDIYEFTYRVRLFPGSYCGSLFADEGEGGREIVLLKMLQDLPSQWGCFIICPWNTIALLERVTGYGI